MKIKNIIKTASYKAMYAHEDGNHTAGRAWDMVHNAATAIPLDIFKVWNLFALADSGKFAEVLGVK